MTPVLLARAEPLEPRAVVGLGPVAAALSRRLVRGPAERLEALTFVHAPQLLLALGPSESLPWVPGVTYLGAEPRQPGLLLPTTRQTSVPLALVERAVRRQLGVPSGPLALVRLDLVVPLARAHRLDEKSLHDLGEPS